MKKLILLGLSVLSVQSSAWGKRGHQAVCETAALAVAGGGNAGFMRSRAFDFGYYCNVPDFIWKSGKNYQTEKTEHYMDLEYFDAAFKKQPEVTKPFDLSRKEFDAKFPEVKNEFGRAFWRVREINDQISALTEQLKSLPDEKVKEKQALQEKWLVLVGLMGHYIGDLAQPLHTTKNHDGQESGQKGIHSFYEDESVDQMYPGFRQPLQDDVNKRWPKFKKENEKKTLNELMEQLARKSFKDIEPLLTLDRKSKRDPLPKSTEKYRKMIMKNMADGALTLAEIYRRQLGFKFNNDRFYFFAGEPEYIQPGEAVKK